MRLVHALKTQAAKNDSGDRAALVLLFPLVRLGPLRQGALAELVHADPSTVSRHVAALVERGLVQRVADESDGRASRLHVTDAGHAALDAFRRDRENHFAQVTARLGRRRPRDPDHPARPLPRRHVRDDGRRPRRLHPRGQHPHRPPERDPMSHSSTRVRAADRRDARAAAAAPDASGVFTHRQILTILGGLMLGMFLAALDQTVVSTAIRTIADDLNGYDLQAWATTAFLITSTISTPLYGKLSDLYGRRPFYLFAIGIFVVGSMLCGLADSMYQLAAFRAIQGIGAGGLMSLALAIIGDIVPPRERSRYQGMFMAVFGTSSVLGPVIGGFFAGQDSLLGITGWRWIFYLNVPLGIAAFAVVMRVLHLPHTRREHRIDWPGALALIVCLVPLLIVAEQGRIWGWDSGRALLCYAIGVDRADRVHPRRAGVQGRRPAAAAHVQEPQLRGEQRRQHRPGRRHVRRHPAAAAVPADRARLEPDGGRPADDPAGGGHHDRRHGLRHRDREDRQVQDLPAGRHRASSWRHWSRCRSSSTPTPRCGPSRRSWSCWASASGSTSSR